MVKSVVVLVEVDEPLDPPELLPFKMTNHKHANRTDAPTIGMADDDDKANDIFWVIEEIPWLIGTSHNDYEKWIINCMIFL